MVVMLGFAPPSPDPDRIPTKRPRLGDWLIVCGEAVKKHPTYHQTVWERTKIYSAVPGMYVGRRFVFDGKTKEDIEYGETGEVWSNSWSFERKARHEVWLFVINEHQNPVYVFPDQCEIWEQGE